MTRTSLPIGPLLPHDVLFFVLDLLPLRDRLALSSISHATRTATVDSCFSHSKIRVFADNSKEAHKRHETLQNSMLPFRASIKKIHVVTSNNSWPSFIYKMLSLLPNLHSVFTHIYESIYLSRLPSLFDALSHAPLRHISIGIFVDEVIPVIAGLPGLETLNVTWSDYSNGRVKSPTVNVNLGDFSWGLIQPSIDTLLDLRLDLTIAKDEDEAAFNLGLLKPAKLHTFSYIVASTNTDVIAQLPAILPHLKNLSLLWKSWPGEGQPGFDVSQMFTGLSLLRGDVDAFLQKSFVKFFAQLPNLTHLTLCLDLEMEVDDLMQFSHDMAWYNRSLHRRLHASELLAKHCLALECIDWMQLGIDSEGNDMKHSFVVEETPGSGRIVKTMGDWWMVDHYKDGHGGPLPNNLIEKASYFD